MDRADFYAKATKALTSFGWNCGAEEFSEEDADIGLFGRTMNVLSAIGPPGAGSLNSDVDEEQFNKDLDSVRTYTDVACYRYVASQPTLLAFVDGDAQQGNEWVDLARRFQTSVVGFAEHAGYLGPKWPKWARTKLGAFGILVFVFSDGTRAGEFNQTYKKKCRIWNLWKKVQTYGWSVDLEADVIERHAGMPLVGVLDPKKLSEAVFGES